MSPEQRQALARAHERVRELLGPATSASRSAWVTGVLAGLSLLFGLASPTSLAVGVGLALIAWNEARGAKLLRALDPRGPRLLGWNQLGFMGLIIAYSLWSLYSGLTGPSPLDAYPELASMLPSRSELDAATWVMYGGLIVLTPLFQGRKARRCFAHEARLQAYLDETPAWLVDLQRSSMVS